MLSGTPAAADAGKSAVIAIAASDGSDSASLAPFTIQVNTAAVTGAASLAWTAPTTNTNGTEVTNLAGYHIYYGTNESSLNQTVTLTDPATTAFTISGLAQGVYYFSVVAYNAMGVDSPESNEVSITIT